MSANITLRITAVPVNGQSQEDADAKLVEVFAAYPPEAIAATLSGDIWTNTDAGWLGLQVEILDGASAGAAKS
jgi:hypothetical protein